MNARVSTSAPSQRQLRVGELVRHALSDVLSHCDIRDEDLSGAIVSVPEVRMTPDLKLATCYVMPLGGRQPEKVAAALERNRRFLRGAVARRVDLRHAPDLRFRVDQSFAAGDKIDALLRSPMVQRDLDKPASED